VRAVLDPLIGRTVGGRYRLISRLGQGGMSSVYLARHVMIDRLMAIKTLRRDLAADPMQRERFLGEARAVNRINHDNIVEITDFGESDDGMVYLVMEYVPGESLLKVMGPGPFPALRALDVAEQIANALSRAHQMGVVHRDLKPENIIILQKRGRPDFVKLLDFGIAKIMDAPSMTGSQQIFGTPGYIAPEYIQSAHIDGRADLYSLGVILYEMVTGALPFDYEYPGDLLVKHVTEQPIPLRKRLPTVEPPMEELVLRCLRKSPQDRFRDAFHFLAELAKTRERLGSETSWGGLTEAQHDAKTAVARADTADEGLPQVSVSLEIDGQAEQRSGTREYDRHTIPMPPPIDGIDVPIDVEVQEAKAAAAEPPRPAGAPTPIRLAAHGLLGAKRWRTRFDAIRAALDDVDAVQPGPPEIAQAMAFATHTLEALEDGGALAEQHQSGVEELSARARSLRAALGRAIDDLGKKLSERRGEFELLVVRRDDLRAAREVTRQQARAAEAHEGKADAVLWELAAVEEELRAQGSRCDELEFQLAALRRELDQHNERIEHETESLVLTLDAEMLRLEPLAAALRAPLDRVERFLLERSSAESLEPQTTKA
jgi:serine/threonine-protein kinase